MILPIGQGAPKHHPEDSNISNICGIGTTDNTQTHTPFPVSLPNVPWAETIKQIQNTPVKQTQKVIVYIFHVLSAHVLVSNVHKLVCYYTFLELKALKNTQMCVCVKFEYDVSPMADEI